MSSPSRGQVLVQVVPVEDGREISWGSNKVQNLADRIEDIKAAITLRVQHAVADSLPTMPHA